MSKIKLTKGELKKQRDSLKQFRRYLPTLQLKKQQLQMKILETRRELQKVQAKLNDTEDSIKLWVGLLADESVNLQDWITPEDVITDSMNIAGANVPVFKEVTFKKAEYDLYLTPFWTDQAVEQMKNFVALKIEYEIIKKQIELLEKELRVTTQRVNLFEKIKIPEGLENIRKIRIYLGDQQANAVGVSKVAKKKVEIKAAMAV
ncbi:MAG: V-type ATP synthase subunit D [Candidatus Omnitrophica bacterium]|nr:V-type ATP synthase subunit D [Candidatus Omnitrophota bacterium]